MQKSKKFFVSFVFIFLLLGCQSVQEKTNSIVKKENKRLSKFIGKSASELQVELGKPDEDYRNASGNLEFIYHSKKYLIPCERRFEIDPNKIVIGFVSNGCF